MDLPDPGIKWGSPAWQADSLPVEQPGKPKNTGVAYPFSSGSSRPRNLTGLSCNAGGFFASWATREALAPLLPPFFSQVDMSLSCRVYLCLPWFSLFWNVYLGFFPNVYYWVLPPPHFRTHVSISLQMCITALLKYNCEGKGFSPRWTLKPALKCMDYNLIEKRICKTDVQGLIVAQLLVTVPPFVFSWIL